MTISLSDNTPRISYTVNEGATQTAFTVPFEFFAEADLNFYVDGTKKTLTTHYTISGGNGSTGTINTTSGNSVTGASGGSTVVITRSIALSRTTDFPVSGSFAIDTLNTELDRFVAIQADNDDTIDRALHLADSDTAVSMELPLVAVRKGTVLGFNASTGAAEVGPTIANVNSLSAITANINTTAGIAANVTTVAGIASNVTTVAGIASNVTSVAGAITNINALAASAVIADMALLGNADVIADMALLATSDVIADMNTLATSDIVSDLNTLATSDIVSDINTLATSDIVSDLNTLATSDIVSDMNTLATSDIVSDINILATSDIVSDLNTLATSDIVTDLNLLATSAIVEDLSLLATSSVIADMAQLAGSGANPNITTLTASGEIVAASLDISGNIDVDGIANLDVVDIDGAVDMASTLAVAGNLTLSNNNTDDTNKEGHFVARQYDSGTETEGFQVFQTFANSSENRLDLGGASSAFNAVTSIGFHTAANTTTRTGTERMRIDGAGKVGIGESNPLDMLSISSATGDAAIRLKRTDTAIVNDDIYGVINFAGDDSDSNASGIRGFIRGRAQGTGGGMKMEFHTAGGGAALVSEPKMTLDADGKLLVSSSTPIIRLTDTDTNAYSEISSSSSDGNLMFYADQGNSQANTTIRFYVDSSEKARLDAAGNLGIGTTSTSSIRLQAVTPTANHVGLQVENSNTADSFGMVVKGGNDANDYTADFRKRDNTNIMRIRGDGNVGIGTTSPSAKVEITTDDNTNTLALVSTDADANTAPNLNFRRSSASPADGDGTGAITFTNNNDAGEGTDFCKIDTWTPDVSNGTEDGEMHIRVMKNGTLRNRIGLYEGETVFNQEALDIDFRVESDDATHALFVDGANDALCFGKSSDNVTVRGSAFSNLQSGGHHYLGICNDDSTSSNSAMYINRQSADGDLITFRQANSTEGTISVSGSTVSYNGFAGRHESSGIPTNTAVGTVVSTIDELDVYPNKQPDIDGEEMANPKAGQTRADHAKVKVSDAVGDACVYGVVAEFTAQDKVIVTSVGIGSVKVTGACAKGDLLESNGDGTAKVQSDDIIRSKTIGKVTIGNSNTGVKLVSCVMYCG